MAAGFDAFLVKPFEFGDLAADDRAPVRAARPRRGRSVGVIKASGEHVSAICDKSRFAGDAGLALTFASRPAGLAPAAAVRRLSARGAISPGLARRSRALGALEVRLATSKKEIRRAQKLRYRVFFEEGGATPDPTARLIRRDVCRFDRVCDHLIVVDKTRPARDGSPRVVGAYRLLAAGRRRAQFRLLQRARIRRRGADRAPPGDPASSRSAAPASRRATAASTRSNCCGAASGPMRAITASTR